MTSRPTSHLALDVAVAVGALVLAGCSAEPRAEPPRPVKSATDRDKGVTRTLVEEMSGYRAVQQGQVMKEKIQTLSAEHDADVSAVLDDRAPRQQTGQP